MYPYTFVTYLPGCSRHGEAPVPEGR